MSEKTKQTLTLQELMDQGYSLESASINPTFEGYVKDKPTKQAMIDGLRLAAAAIEHEAEVDDFTPDTFPVGIINNSGVVLTWEEVGAVLDQRRGGERGNTAR